MYVLLNTAVSKQWGFPLECPDNCLCKKFDCHSSDYAQRCGFPANFCKMMTDSDRPQYKVNYVRVYQNPDWEEQKVGCSTPERPTRQYIEAHEKLYKRERDVSTEACMERFVICQRTILTCSTHGMSMLATSFERSAPRDRTV